MDKDISEKQNFFVNRSVPENFQRENLSGQVATESLALRIQKIYMKGGTKIFWPCFGRPKLGECNKMGSVSKIMSRQKKFIRPQFSKYRFQIESAWAHRLWAHADSIWKQYLVYWKVKKRLQDTGVIKISSHFSNCCPHLHQWLLGGMKVFGNQTYSHCP